MRTVCCTHHGAGAVAVSHFKVMSFLPPLFAWLFLALVEDCNMYLDIRLPGRTGDACGHTA